jgi:hypothetical protein
MTNHQRKGSTSNTQVGRDFESKSKGFLAKELKCALQPNFSVKIGINGKLKKPHSFDLGSNDKKVIVECKSHTWTESGNVPSAKMATWNQAMYFFLAAPKGLRKIMFVLSSYNQKRKESLAEYYIKTYSHLIPEDVEIWEYDEKNNNAHKMKIPKCVEHGRLAIECAKLDPEFEKAMAEEGF